MYRIKIPISIINITTAAAFSVVKVDRITISYLPELHPVKINDRNYISLNSLPYFDNSGMLMYYH